MSPRARCPAVRTDPRAWFPAAIERIAAVPRWPITSVALAAFLLAMPLQASRLPVYHSLSVPKIAILAMFGLAIGWIVLDRLAAVRAPVVAMVTAVIALAGGIWLASNIATVRDLGVGEGATRTLAVAFVFGALVRGVVAGRRSMASLVALAAVASWLAYDIPHLPSNPLRDIHLYLGAGETALGGASPYLTAPLVSTADLEKLPFVYPPFTIPLFELLASIPRPIADAVWVGGSIAAVVAAFWLLGIRGRWLLVLLAWPAPAVGIAVGNVASYTFFLYVLGFRVGAALVLSSIFKIQSVIPVLWLVLERRWRELAAGVAIIAVLAIVSVPIVGLETWTAWPNGLFYFQETLAKFPVLRGVSLVSRQGATVALGLTVVVVGFALLGRGRNGLARFGLASVVASPTLYFHGLTPLLAGSLFLGPELLWFFLGLGPWTVAWGIKSAWLAMGMVGLALLARRGDDLRLPNDLSPARADVHPAGQTGQVWPD